MIFAAETEERSLHVFRDADTAASYCEAMAVGASLWMFWDDDGAPLQPEFDIPNKHGVFTSTNGVYHLVPMTEEGHARLADSLDEIVQVIGEPPFTTVLAVREYLNRHTTEPAIT